MVLFAVNETGCCCKTVKETSEVLFNILVNAFFYLNLDITHESVKHL